MFEVFFLTIAYFVVALIMYFLPYPDGGIVVEVVRWCLFLFGSWTLVMLFSHVKRVATDFHAMTIGKPDMENLPEWAELDADGKIQLKDDFDSQ